MLNNELYHYGIKGQKRGVRRFQNLDRTWTDEGKIRYGKSQHLSREFNSKVKSDEDITINKTNRLFRVSGESDDGDSMKYTTFRDNDRLYYLGDLPQRRRLEGKDSYEHEYELKEDLFIPSKDKRKEMLNQLYDDDDVLKEWVGDDLYRQELDYFGGDDTAALKDIREQLNVLDNESKAIRMAANIGMRPFALTSYGKLLVENGFNATVDDHGTSFGELPIIVVSSNKSMIEKGKQYINDEMSRNIQKKGMKIIKAGRKFRKNVDTLRFKNY